MTEILKGRDLDLLRIVANGGEMTGGDVKAAVPMLPRGTIYPILAELAKQGYLTKREHRDPRAAGPPRVYYKINAKGQQALRNGELAQAKFAAAVRAT